MSHRTRPAPLPGRPRRLVTCTHGHVGIVIGPEPTGIAAVRQWASRATRTTPTRSQDVALVVSELATNAVRHTRSGHAGGSVVVELFTEPDDYVVHVTDDGPPADDAGAYPRIKEIADEASDEASLGLGLRLVEAISRGWSWLLNDDGTVTVQARVPRSGSVTGEPA